MSAEIVHTLRTDEIPPEGVAVTVLADEAARAALAARLGIPSVLALACTLHLTRAAAGVIHVRGRLTARLRRVCVISLAEFEAGQAEDFELRFVPAGSESAAFDPDAPDEIPYSAGRLDLGAAVAEQLALGLDPYPRAPDAPAYEAPGPEASENPFARLARLRPRP